MVRLFLAVYLCTNIIFVNCIQACTMTRTKFAPYFRIALETTYEGVEYL